MWVDNTDRRLIKATQHYYKSEIMKSRTNILAVKNEKKEPDMRGILQTKRIDLTRQLFGL